MSNLKTVKAVRARAAVAVLAGPMTAAMATNGYFSHGYGIKAKDVLLQLAGKQHWHHTPARQYPRLLLLHWK